MPPRLRRGESTSTPVSSVSSEAEDSRSNDRPDPNMTEDQNQAKISEVQVNTRQMRKLDNNAGKFLENWTPESSNRETRKLTRKIYKEGGRKSQSYNEQGIFIKNNSDFCDCLEANCPGCHFPCPKCTSPKCGHECRNNRKWTYDCVEIEGAPDFTIRNSYK